MNTRMTEKNGRVDNLIQKLCNNNIKTVTLQQICNKITTGKLDANAMEEGGQYPFFTCSRKTYKINSYRFDCEALIIAGNGEVGETKYYKGKFDAYQRTYVLYEFNEEVDVQYLFHYLRGYLKPYVFALSKKGSIPYITLGILKNFPIPLPPLPIQQEIVRILDTFTNLTAELTAELTARRKQYEYYRDELLTFGEDVEYKKLGEVVSMKAGKAIKAQDIGEKNELFSIPCYGGNGLRGYVKDANCSGDKVLIGRQGALCGNVCFVSGEFYATEHAVVVSSDNNVDMRFLFHMLLKLNLNQYKTAGAQPGLSVSKLETVKVQIPSIEYQRRVSKVLDLFSRYIDNLEDGLPAEISARQKQYEYYRDQLLSFQKEKE